jgi:hypothetical protein
MMHPIGSLPPHVYWRRRVMLGGALAAVILLVLTVFALSSNGTTDEASSAGGSSSHPAPTSPTGATSPAPTTPAPSQTSSAAAPASGSSSGATTPNPASPASSGSASAVVACIGAQLTVSAGSQAPTYKVGDQPVLTLLVTNNGPGNCTQDLADSQVQLVVYNGAARVWGSHDCLIQPGTDLKTLVAGSTVGVQITWSGLSAQPACAGTRQRVGAGTYTLYPYLAGAQGTAAQFSIT